MLNRQNLHSYQQNIIAKARNLSHMALYLSMGMGKSTIALSILAEKQIPRTLIVAPLQVARNVWETEVAKWEHLEHLTVSLVLGTAAQRKAALEKEAAIYITNYDSLKWLDDNKYLTTFTSFVFDESSRLKSPTTMRFKIVKKLFKHRIEGHTMLLSGTPCPQNISDLWTQIGLLDKGARLETTLTKFRQVYMEPGQRNRQTGVVYNWQPKNGAMEEIQGKLRDIAFSLQAKDYLDVPKEIPTFHELTLSKPVMETYKALKKDLATSIAGTEITAVNAATALTKLLQVSSGAVYDAERNIVPVHSEKLELLTEILEADNDPVLLFYNFKHSLSRIVEAFPDARPVTTENIALWKAGKLKIMYGHPMSISEGLNLQNNSGDVVHIIWFDLFFSASLYLQGNARCARQGAEKPVLVHHLIAKNTVDEQVIKVLDGKISVQQALMDSLSV